MKIAKRVVFFIITNLLVMATVSIVFNIVTSFLGIDYNSYYSYLMLWSLAWGMGGAFISLLLSKKMAKWMMGVTIIPENSRDQELRSLVSRVHALAQRAGLRKMPEVGIYDSAEINAFATGPSKNNSLVAVSTGLLHKMSTDEVDGVLGHEVAHIANGDMVTMTLIQGVINAFVIFFSRILASVIASQADEKYRHGLQFGLSFLFDILFSVLGSLAVCYFSRMREYRADAGGAQFAGKQKMIAGLKRLMSYQNQIASDDTAFAAMKISNRGGFISLFSTHPRLEDRIRALETIGR
jgi:heat shock protein HtpX